MKDLPSYLWYEFSYGITLAAMTLGFSLRFHGRNNIPKSGPALLLANHQSFLDPVAVGLASPRHLCYLARKTLFRNRLFSALLRSYNVVPVDLAGIAKEGLKTILDQLHAGQAVLVYPEGERTRKGNLQPLKPGVLLLVKRCDAPIVPIGVAGAFEALSRAARAPHFSPLFWPATGSDIAVSIGRPVPSTRYRDMPREQALEELQKLLLAQQQDAQSLRRKS
jgi:1-acyl-sn-glycerol-3-phosphate acyltransferase